MNDNLASMIDKTDQEPINSPTSIDLNNDNNNIPEKTYIDNHSGDSNQFDISTSPFPDWFEQNHMNFSDIGHVRVSISDVDSRQDLIFKVPDPKGETFEDGRLKKRLRLFEDADKIPVLDLPSQEMKVYKSNSFQIIYDLGSGKFIRSYGVKTGLINVFCVSINNVLIPYARAKMRKRDTGINMIEPNLTSVQNKLREKVDVESLQIQYSQISKSINELSTVGSVIDWFNIKIGEVHDVSHLLQIDDVMIHLVN